MIPTGRGCPWAGLLIVSSFLLCQGPIYARGKTDIIILENGDKVTGEIKKLERGKLTLSTDSMGTVSIDWLDIQRITSQYSFVVETESGERFFGSIEPAGELQTIRVIGEDSSAVLDQPSVVEMTPIQDTFLDRLDGSVSVGLNVQRANRLRNLTLDAEVSWRARRRSAQATYSSSFSNQEGTSGSSTRNVLGLQWQQSFRERWFGAVVGQFSQNDELALDFRSVTGGGLGRRLVQNNRTILSSVGGVVFSRERFSGETASSNVEALWGVDYALFVFDDPETDISTRLLVFPSLTRPGRVRIDLETRIKYELFKDFFWSVSLFDNYDSDPPAADVGKNDFGITTSVGWSF